MIDTQSTGSASPTGLAHHHSGEERIMDTRSITVKTVCDSSGNLPRTILARQGTLGDNADKSVQVRRITNIPAHISDVAALRLFEQTADCTWLGGKAGRLEFDFAELGVGKIIR